MKSLGSATNLQDSRSKSDHTSSCLYFGGSKATSSRRPLSGMEPGRRSRWQWQRSPRLLRGPSQVLPRVCSRHGQHKSPRSPPSPSSSSSIRHRSLCVADDGTRTSCHLPRQGGLAGLDGSRPRVPVAPFNSGAGSRGHWLSRFAPLIGGHEPAAVWTSVWCAICKACRRTLTRTLCNPYSTYMILI